LIFPETLQVFFLLLTALIVGSLAASPTKWKAAAFGVLWGIAGLTRPEATYLLPALLLPVVTSLGTRWSFRFRLLGIAAFLNGVVMAPWIIRNAFVYGALVIHVPVTGSMLFFGSYPHAPVYGRFWHYQNGVYLNITTTEEYQEVVAPFWLDGAREKYTSDRWKEIVVNSEREYREVDHALGKRAKMNIRDYPISQLRNGAFHLIDLWKRPAGWAYMPFAAFKWVWMTGYVIFVLAALGGAIRLAVMSRCRGVPSGWITFMLMHSGVMLIFYTEPRYQSSSSAFLCISAAVFVAKTFFGSRIIGNQGAVGCAPDSSCDSIGRAQC
jgi:hypothetical protein